MNSSEKLEKLLKHHGLRLTQPRRVVFEFLINSGEPVQLHQIIALQGNWADRASLYRTIKLYKELGVVREVHRSGGDWLELGEDFSPHHHHLTCTGCGLSQVIHSPQLEYQLTSIAELTGFRPLEHHVEMIGICHSCLGASGDQQIIK